MAKHVHVVLDNIEHRKLQAYLKKNKLTWHDLLMSVLAS